MHNLIQITVEPHVATYLRHHFGVRMSLSEKNIISTLLVSLFEPFDKVDPFLIKNQRKESLGDFFDVYINDSMLRKYGGHLSNESISKFNESVDLIIKQDMYRWCHHPNADFKQVDYNIKRFIDFYGFDDHLNFDNLKRWYYRERKRIADRNKRVTEFEPALTIPILKIYYPERLELQQQLSFF